MDAGTGNWKDNILLPIKQQPTNAIIGDYLDVFIYRDSEERLIATTRETLAEVGDLAYLKVTAQTKIGAFLDIGLERGLFLPFREQKFPLELNRSYLVYAYLDKTGRISCTTDIYKYLTSDSPYRKNDKVNGTVYSVKPDTGAFVAVDNKYMGLIPKSEYFSNIKEGDIVSARVIRVREDRKLDLSPRELSFRQMDNDAEILIKTMENEQGYLELNEKSDPEDIERKFQMSKAAFKRAIGKLLKTKKIIKTESGYKII